MKNFLAILTFTITVSSAAQEYGLGLDLNDRLFESAPRAAVLMRGDLENLPSASSLKNYAPSPGSQGSLSTCTGWAASYAARTILAARKYGWTESETDSNAFSPSFIYNLIRVNETCRSGASIVEALDMLREKGDVMMRDFGYECDRRVTDEDFQAASRFRIMEYRVIAERNTKDKSRLVKKGISEGKPVVIAFDCPYSFRDAGEVWIPGEGDYKEWSRGHAMTVVGYDDNKSGGAFEIMNSWGTGWGKDGFTWIKYSDFEFFCKMAFEVFDRPDNDSSAYDLAGSLSFRLSSGDQMRTRFNGRYFEMEKGYPSGTLFDLHISNNEPAYVYALSTDTTYRVRKLFPLNARMNPYLPYSSNNVAIPDENTYCMLDTVKGTSWFCFLYSREKLDIDMISGRLEKAEGTFRDRLSAVLGNKMVNGNNIKFKGGGTSGFMARSRNRSVVPLLIEIKVL